MQLFTCYAVGLFSLSVAGPFFLNYLGIVTNQLYDSLLVDFLQTDHWKWRCSEAIKSNFGLVGAYLQIHSSLSYTFSLKLEFVRSMSAVRRVSGVVLSFLPARRCCCRDTGRQRKKSQSPATPTCLKKNHVCSTKCTCILAGCSSTR